MSNLLLSPADVAVIVLSLLIVTVVGIWAGRRSQQSASGYFLASRNAPWYLVGSAFVATSVSSEQIVGTAGAAYQHGLPIANWEWFTLPYYTLLIVLFIPIYLKNRIGTVSELLTRRFEPLCGDIYSWVMLVAYTFIFLVSVIYGGSLAISQLTGWETWAVAWGMVLFVALYSIQGGLSSVLWTDAVQCIMLVAGGVILFIVALRQVPGGWQAMVAANPDRFHLYRPPGDPIAPFLGMWFAAIGVALFYQAANQVMIQRVLAARSLWDGIMGIVFAGYINFFRPIVTCFLGLIVYHWIFALKQSPPLPHADVAFPFGLAEFAPEWGLRGVVLAGFLAAVMSTISALSNSTGTIFGLDIYRRLLNPRATDRQVIRIGRGAACASLVIATLLSPAVRHLGGLFVYFQTGVTYLATPFISVILLGILWKRTNRQGALFGLAGGLVIQFSLALALPAAGLRLHWLYVAFIAQMCTMAGVVIVSAVTPPPAPEQSEPFAWRPAFLRYLDGDRPWYAGLKLWYGIYAVIWITIYWAFW